nr:PREDICTED: melanocortin-2 receptor accessory protein 2 isoform X1 [Lepisosteus oculatus]
MASKPRKGIKAFLNSVKHYLAMSQYSHNSNKTRHTARGPDYYWEYEYYDYDEPVSFEGLKAHRYSIVIGFWVGLAVFVIFMFFVLTLLTKTGAPHPENSEPGEKRHRITSCAIDINCPQDLGNKGLSRRATEESRSLFHCYINEVDNGDRGKLTSKASSLEHSGHQTQGTIGGDKLGEEMNSLAHFNIPNFVSSEHSSMLGDDDLLLCEQPINIDGESRPNSLN